MNGAGGTSRPAVGSSAGTSRVRLRDVAQAADVSLSVVSRVLNQDPTLRLRPEKRDRVVRVARELGYRPNAAGRSLRTRSTGAIGVMLPKITNPYFADLIQGIEDECDTVDLTPILGRSERLRPGSSILARMVDEGRVDGFILQLTDELSTEDVDAVLAPSVPRVLVQSHTAGQKGSVVLDVAEGIRVATEHLISLGHTDIAFATGRPHHDTAQIREEAFRAAMGRAGLSVEERWVARAGLYFEDGDGVFRGFWSTGSRPTAILAANVNLGLGILRAAVWAGVEVPGALSVISLHDSELAEQSIPPMSTVRMPVYELGGLTVRHLQEILAGGEPREIVLSEPPPELVVRGSTQPVRSQPSVRSGTQPSSGAG